MNSFLRASVIIAIFFAPESFASEGSGPCSVSVLTTMKSGKIKKRIFNTKSTTEAGCAEDAALHTTNYFPPKIAKKEVEYRFGGRPAVSVQGDSR
jgi:hypothetical protein